MGRFTRVGVNNGSGMNMVSSNIARVDAPYYSEGRDTRISTIEAAGRSFAVVNHNTFVHLQLENTTKCAHAENVKLRTEVYELKSVVLHTLEKKNSRHHWLTALNHDDAWWIDLYDKQVIHHLLVHELMANNADEQASKIIAVKQAQTMPASPISIITSIVAPNDDTSGSAQLQTDNAHGKSTMFAPAFSGSQTGDALKIDDDAPFEDPFAVREGPARRPRTFQEKRAISIWRWHKSWHKDNLRQCFVEMYANEVKDWQKAKLICCHEE